ncbi:hypothetical protein PFISCL1PPCAC_7567 [Pristionchus fissidentatus]|uniref:Protein NDNF C-terminal domain-containing protein n=1 Tax=Pristionchus fissidentatus TaxID=1538716 RepID=A0AAV5VCJ7_9BILA|nr:hypothetical protein PFISCL1PPCAC_7567 [Pristionchus fissidentatus]
MILLFLPFLFLPTLISSLDLPTNDLHTFSVESTEPTNISLGRVSAQFFLSISPCGAVHWKLFKVTKDGVGEPQLVAGEEGESKMSFYSSKLDGENLLLLLSSPLNTSVDVVHSSSQSSLDEIYPPLPSDTRAFVSFETSNSSSVDALVHWKISPHIKSFPDKSRYRFCVLLSTEPLTSSLSCHLSSQISEDIRCHDTTNQMEVVDLKPGRSYFATVFIRDSRHATISSYDSLQMIVPGEKPETTIPLLSEGTIHHLEIPGPRGHSLSYQFQSTGQTAKRALLTVFACSGYVRVSVWRGKKLLKKSEPFTSFRRFSIINGNGRLRIEIINDENRPNNVKVWIGRGNGDSPYAALPDDTSVRVVRRGCDWADIQWFRSSDANDEYCVYARKERSDLIEQIIGKVENDCSNGVFPHSSLVGCYTHKGAPSDGTIGILQTTVTGLPVDATSRFDVLVRPSNRSNAQSLPYRTLWVRTAPAC